MNALILMAHGSRSAVSNKEVIDLTNDIRKKSPGQFVTHAFLDVLPPTLQDALNIAVKKGAKNIHVLPIFLNSGNHVSTDIPRMIEEGKSHHPGISIQLLRHIGSHPKFFDLVEDIARNTSLYIANS